MKPLLTGTRSIHEILSAFGNASMLADLGVSSPVALFSILASGLGLTAYNIYSDYKEQASMDDFAARIDELAEAGDPCLTSGIVAKPADIALAFEIFPEMKTLPAWGMPFDDIRRPWLLLVQWLGEQFKSAASDRAAIDKILCSLREGLDTRLAILSAEQRELFTRQSQELTDHVNETAAAFSQKLAAIHGDVLESRRLDDKGHTATQKELKEIKDQLRWQPAAPGTFQNIPHARRADFTGRDGDVQEISAHLSNLDTGGALPFVLHGPPGVGKTTLACEILHRLHADGSLTHILHLPAGDPGVLTSLLEALATQLQLVPGHLGKIDTAIALGALQVFLQSDERKVLLYFDNADSPPSIDAVQSILASFGHPRALVTSRQADWPEACCRPLELWSDTDSADYLNKRLPNLSTDEGRILISTFGGLPIAFDLAISAIVRFHLTASELIERWKTKLATERIPARGRDYTVKALLFISLESLPEKPVGLFFVLVHFAPQSIPLALLEGDETDSIRDDLATLASASLISWDYEGVQLHPFLREILLQSFPLELRLFDFTTAISLLSKHLPKPEWSNRWNEWPRLLPHTTALIEHPLVGLIAKTEHQDELRWLIHLLNQTSLHNQYRAAHHEAEPQARQALTLIETFFGINHPEISTILNNLAQILQATNRLPEAEAILRRALAIDETPTEENRANIVISLNNLAGTLKAQRRYAEAESLMRRVLEVDDASPGNGVPFSAIHLNNLGRLLHDTGRLDEAEKLLRRALEICEDFYGKGHPMVANRLSNLAGLLKDKNNFAEAEPLMRRALEIDQASYGDDHPVVAIRLNNLAGLLGFSNRFSEAEPLCRRHLSILAEYGRWTGHEHPHFKAGIGNYEALLRGMGLDEDTIHYYVQFAIEPPLRHDS